MRMEEITMTQDDLKNKIKGRIKVYNDLIKRLNRVTSGNYMHAIANIKYTLKCMVDNDKALINDIDDYVEKKED